MTTQTYPRKLLTLLYGFLFIAASTLGFAQSDASANEAQEAPQSSSLFTKIKQGGWAMYPLGFLSISAFALTIYNFTALRPKDFFDGQVADRLGERLGELDISGAANLCAQSQSPLTRIVHHGLDSIKGGQVDPELFQQRLDAGSTKEMAQPFVIINYLSIIASIAPMVGLLGTVSGMVKAFDSIATIGMGQPEVLAGNISEALITTASGMMVGIPTMFFFFYFKNQYGKLVADMTMHLDDVYGNLIHGLRTADPNVAEAESDSAAQGNPQA